MIEIGDLLYRKASQLLLNQVTFADESDYSNRDQWIRSRLADLRDGQILFCKNNICVHDAEAEVSSTLQRPTNRCLAGYFTLKVQFNSSKYVAGRRSSVGELKSTVACSSSSASPSSTIARPLSEINLIFTWIPNAVFKQDHCDLSLESLLDNDLQRIKFPGYARRCSSVNDGYDENRNRIKTASFTSDESEIESNPSTPNESKSKVKLETRQSKQFLQQMYQIELKDIHSLRLFFDTTSTIESKTDANESNSSIESGIDSINLSSNDLNDSNSSSSESNEKLVIGSTRSRFKILHFHNGGLDRLADVLNEWKFLFDLNRHQKTSSDSRARIERDYRSLINGNARFLYYCINPPQIAYADCHPDEHRYTEIRDLKDDLDEDGCFHDWNHVRHRVFFAGMDFRLRHELWPFLLQRFPIPSVTQQRAQMKQQARMLYDKVDQNRLAMRNDENSSFYRRYGSTIEKDVPRTDRKNITLRSDRNTQMMERVLLNFAFHCPEIGYTQGMSDLLAPLVLAIEDESEVFACFVQMMRHKRFVCRPNDQSMDECIATIRELLRVFDPRAYQFYTQDNIRDLLFTHRWMLLCFRREFNKCAAMTIWQCCWTEIQTPCFQYFVCIAIILMYGQDAVDRNLSSDDVLLHFACLSKQMDSDLVLKKARGLLHRLRSRNSIPCSLLHVLHRDECASIPIQCIQHTNTLDVHLCPCTKPSDC